MMLHSYRFQRSASASIRKFLDLKQTTLPDPSRSGTSDFPFPGGWMLVTISKTFSQIFFSPPKWLAKHVFLNPCQGSVGWEKKRWDQFFVKPKQAFG